MKQLEERLRHELEKSSTLLEEARADIEEKQCSATSYFNALEVKTTGETEQQCHLLVV